MIYDILFIQYTGRVIFDRRTRRRDPSRDTYYQTEDKELYDKAMALMDQEVRFELDILYTKEVQVQSWWKNEYLAGAICEDGLLVEEAVRIVIEKAHEKMRSGNYARPDETEAP